MTKTESIRTITGLGILAALVVVLQLIANYISFGPVSITLSLTPIVIGSILYGKKGGALLGSICGVIVLFAPSTATFFSYNPFVTIVLCILKMGLAGFMSGLAYELIKKKKESVAIVVASILTPIINTGLFALGTIIFFLPLIGEGVEAVKVLFLTVIGWNFVVEFIVNVILSPTVIYITRIINRQVLHKK